MNWKQVVRAHYPQVLFVCGAFFLMVTISCFTVSQVIRREVMSTVSVALGESEKTIRSYLREPGVAFTNIYVALQDKLDRGESQENILQYLTRINLAIKSSPETILGFRGAYGYIRNEFIDSIGMNPGPDYVPQSRPWYQLAVRKSSATYTAPYRDNDSGKSVITCVQELYGKTGDYYGVLALDVDLSWVMEYAKSLRFTEGGYGMIVNQYLSVIAHPEGGLIDKPLQDIGGGFAAVAEQLRRHKAVTALSVEDINGKNVIVFFRELYNGWYVGSVMPASAYYADLYNTALILIALGAILSGALSFLLLRLSAEKMRSDEENKHKSSFLAVISHEIRTPLNAIIGLSEIQMRKSLPEDTRADLEKVYHSGVNLLGIINDLLDLSKIEAGGLEIVPGRYALPGMINDAVQLNMVRIGSKPIRFVLELDGTLPGALVGDELRVKQVLNNLLSNAIKYTREGSVTLGVTWKPDGEGGFLVFRVADTGIGIRKEDAKKLFQKYAQMDSRKNRGIEGTGLGLAISKQLADKMGGTLSLQSEYGKGSVFTASLRQGVADATPMGDETARQLTGFCFAAEHQALPGDFQRESLSGKRVLVVDDIEINREVAGALLEQYGLAVDMASGGAEAVERMKDPSVRYDAVFMDHMMPDMDGVEATRIIRNEIGSAYARQVPIIALTANALVGNEDMFLSKGFSAFLSKPISTTQLDALLKRWLGPS